MKIFFFYIPFWSSSLAVVVVVVVKYFFHNEESFNAIYIHTNDSNTTKNRYVLMFQKPMYSLYIYKSRLEFIIILFIYIYTRYMLKLFFFVYLHHNSRIYGNRVTTETNKQTNNRIQHLCLRDEKKNENQWRNLIKLNTKCFLLLSLVYHSIL